MTPFPRWVRGSIGTIAICFLIAACGGSGDLSVEDPWARPSPPGAEVSAFYLEITNDSGSTDRLIAASSSRCSVTEIHNTTMTDGVMSMAPADGDLLAIEDGGTLRLEPGALHIMCMGVTDPFVDGESIDVELEFESAGTISASAVVEQR